MGKEAAERGEMPTLTPVCRTLVRLANNTCTAHEQCLLYNPALLIALSGIAYYAT